MKVGKLAEQGFLEAVLVEEPEIGIVGYGNNVAAGFGNFLDRFHQGITLGNCRSIAARVVGKVEQDNGFPLLFGAVFKSRLESVYIVAAGNGEGRMFLDDRAAASTEGQVIVAPEHVGKDQVITLVNEQVGDDGKAMGQRIGNDWITEVLAVLAGVFPQHFFTPECAQLRFSGRRGIWIDILWIKRGQLVLNALQEHRAAVLGGDADGGVVFVSLVLGFGRLGQDTLWKEEVLSKVGQHFQDIRTMLGKLIVQFLCQWVHRFPPGVLYYSIVVIPAMWQGCKKVIEQHSCCFVNRELTPGGTFDLSHHPFYPSFTKSSDSWVPWPS